MKDFIQNLATKQAHRKACLIDEHLARFLTEQGFQTTPWTVENVKAELLKQNFELVHEIHKYAESEVHTFKLCRVFQTTSLNIPNLEVRIIPPLTSDNK